MEEEDSSLLEEEDSIQDMSGSELLEEEDLIQEICTCSGCLEMQKDVWRKVMDTVIGMPDPRILETQEIDEIEDHRLDPRPYHKDFVEFLRMQQDRMCAGAIDDGREVSVGSYMSPESVLRMLSGLAPTDVFGPLDPDVPESLPEAEEPSEVVSEPVSNQVVRVQAVVG
ncbi:uncharacterized protein METZ01_LOCUS142646 [marine metagenome]|uniref:Uncharacterized protein n=1 Tax=marine metagenome TaxID=408172 RepID=A0A381ZLR1_9ZZZZ